MLSIGARDALQVRKAYLPLSTGIRLLYASDLHLTRWTVHVAGELAATVNALEPDLVLLGGDLVDLPNGLPLLIDCIRSITCPVWAIPGNHDVLVGIARVRAAVELAGGHWLDVPCTFRGIGFSGDVTMSAGCMVLCAHDPSVFPQAMRAGFRLVLAGHLHGGQWIAGEHAGRWYPGAWVYRWNGARFDESVTTMLVSRGVNDTLPLRWNCPREVLLCSL